jgi:site-specific DNA-methyltransferase (adenine-specific)
MTERNVSAELLNTVIVSDAIELCKRLPDSSVDAIITDMPYGTTACTWDTCVDLPSGWQAVKRILKPRGAFVTTASQPFTSALVMSNPAWFKYTWIWIKDNATGFNHAQNMPLKNYEDICVFSGAAIGHKHLIFNRMNYYPQGLIRFGEMNKRASKGFEGTMERTSQSNSYITEYTNYPLMTLHFTGDANTQHPTQKPVALFEYLIKTYTLPGDLILDPFAGSGTTLIAARNTGRRYIGGDITPEYVATAKHRLAEPFTPPMFPDDKPASEPLPSQPPLFATPPADRG